MNEDELVNVCTSMDDRYTQKTPQIRQNFNQTQYLSKEQQQNTSAMNGRSFINDISIEGVDEEGKVTLRSGLSGSSSGRDSDTFLSGSSSQLKWKKKSELSKPISEEKNRISIKGANQYEYKIKGQDGPFSNSGGGRISINPLNGLSSEQRISRISMIIQNQINKQRVSIGGQALYQDFIPEEEDVVDDIDEDFERKFSIRALNFNMMSRLMPQNTILARASSKLMTHSGRNGRGTISARKTNLRKGS